MNISQLNGQMIGLTAAAEIIIDNARPDQPTRVRLLLGETVLLDNDYYGDPNKEVVLDIRDIIRSNTWLPVPGLKDYPEMRFAGDSFRFETRAVLDLTLEVTQYQESVARFCTFLAFPFDFFPENAGHRSEFTPAIDELQVPEDYLLPLSTFWTGLTSGDYDPWLSVTVLSAKGSRFNQFVIFGARLAAASMVSQLVRLSDIPHEVGVPFLVSFSYSDSRSHIVNTPRLKVVRKKMEQYAFLSPEGIYYNIPMSGALREIPEYDIVVLKKADGFEKTSGAIANLHEQNTGALTRKTARALASYLCSDMIYHYDRDSGLWRRILVENPTVSIANNGGVYSLTFKWRYEDNNNYVNL